MNTSYIHATHKNVYITQISFNSYNNTYIHEKSVTLDIDKIDSELTINSLINVTNVLPNSNIYNLIKNKIRENTKLSDTKYQNVKLYKINFKHHQYKKLLLNLKDMMIGKELLFANELLEKRIINHLNNFDDTIVKLEITQDYTLIPLAFLLLLTKQYISQRSTIGTWTF